jgi:hypothetical protein
MLALAMYHVVFNSEQRCAGSRRYHRGMKKYFAHSTSLVGLTSLGVAWSMLIMWRILAPGTSPILLASLGILSAGLVGVVILSLRNSGATQTIAHILHEVEHPVNDPAPATNSVPRVGRI